MFALIGFGILAGWASIVLALYLRGRQVQRRERREFDEIVARVVEPSL